MFDIFYSGPKPNLFAHEREARDIEHARELSRTRYFWWVNYLTDYSNHDFLWEPVPWEADQCHVWPSQHQENGGTMLVPKVGGRAVNYTHGALPRHATGAPIIGIDHGNGLDIECQYTTRFISDYLGTLRRILAKVKEEYVWVTSSVCDYTEFDFTWHPNEWQLDMLHVFASNEQKFGDTFYVHVPSFLKKTESLKILEWFETLHFVEDIAVPRRPIPQVAYTFDTVVDAIWNYDFKSPLVEFYRHTKSDNPPTINLWQEKTRTVIPVSQDSSTVLVPRDCKNYIKTQVYDYPNIDKTKKTLAGQAQDIVFISYDEVEADANYANLLERFPRARRVHGVKGMENALAAAAKVSTTPWYYAVFGKTELYPSWDFSFVPDYFQQPKHYIFYSENRVNKLVYGEMAIILYNCRTILDNRNTEFGLDYTTSFPHEVIPVISTYGNFDTSPYQTWRTAFREVSKLYDIQDRTPSVDTEYRIRIWETVAEGPYAEWALRGARDGRDFFLEFKSDFDYRKNSFDWEWLQKYFLERYPRAE